MINRFFIVAAAVGLAALSGPAMADTEDGPAIYITFYNNAQHTNIVGEAWPSCTPFPHSYMAFGSSSPYREEVTVGYCLDGELYYY